MNTKQHPKGTKYYTCFMTVVDRITNETVVESEEQIVPATNELIAGLTAHELWKKRFDHSMYEINVIVVNRE